MSYIDNSSTFQLCKQFIQYLLCFPQPDSGDIGEVNEILVWVNEINFHADHSSKLIVAWRIEYGVVADDVTQKHRNQSLN